VRRHDYSTQNDHGEYTDKRTSRRLGRQMWSLDLLANTSGLLMPLTRLIRIGWIRFDWTNLRMELIGPIDHRTRESGSAERIKIERTSFRSVPDWALTTDVEPWSATTHSCVCIEHPVTNWLRPILSKLALVSLKAGRQSTATKRYRMKHHGKWNYNSGPNNSASHYFVTDRTIPVSVLIARSTIQPCCCHRVYYYGQHHIRTGSIVL